MRDGADTQPGRMSMPDIARFYGIVLVFYGHIIERIMYLKDPAATVQYKFIYSFHMPFFFLLAGFVANPDRVFLPVGRFFSRQVVSRLAPDVVFTLLLVVLSLFFEGHFVAVDVHSAQGYLKGFLATAMGFPAFNIPLWFLACLLSVEILHFFVGRFLDTGFKLLVAALGFGLAGHFLTQWIQFLPGPNFWFAHEALVVYGFYLAGVYLRRKGFLLGKHPKGWLVTGAAACGLAVLLTFDLNTGPFRLFDAVVIVMSGHGNLFLFVFTALAGSLLLLFLAALSGRRPGLMWLGENTLIFFCLNGVFYHFFNGPFAGWFTANFSANPATVTLAGAAFTLVSLACCVPVVWLLDRFVPQLMGKPTRSGPILPPLVRK